MSEKTPAALADDLNAVIALNEFCAASHATLCKARDELRRLDARERELMADRDRWKRRAEELVMDKTEGKA